MNSNRSSSQPDPLALAALAWLAFGAVLLGLTPLPAHDACTGWSRAFWLLIAPAALLSALFLAHRGLKVPPWTAAFTRRNAYQPPARLRSIRRRNSAMMRR